ncbi:MAG: hypothetical protein AAFX65_07480 [Cyanobacteria bacterium J06638_7]
MITTDAQEGRVTRLARFPGHIWPNSRIRAGGFAYFLDDNRHHPVLLAELDPRAFYASHNEDFTVTETSVPITTASRGSFVGL